MCNYRTRTRKPAQEMKVLYFCGLPARTFKTQEVENLAARRRKKLRILLQTARSRKKYRCLCVIIEHKCSRFDSCYAWCFLNSFALALFVYVLNKKLLQQNILNIFKETLIKETRMLSARANGFFWTLLLCLDWSSLTVAENSNTCDTYMHVKSWSTPESFEFAPCIPDISREMPIYIEWNLFKRQHAVAKINKNHVIVTPWICIKFQTTRRTKVTLLWCIIEMMCTRRFRRLRIFKGGVTQQNICFSLSFPKTDG